MTFVDTSALLKVYVADRGSDVMRALASGTPLIVCAGTYVEARAAFARRRREGVPDVGALDSARRLFEGHWPQLGVVAVDGSLLRVAGDLCDRHPLRAGDAVQLASALRVLREGVRITFVGCDRRLLDAAVDEGLPVLNPEAP
jgi:hypothetical protein